MRKRIGHGPHILRTLMYDECVLDEDLDIRVAGALCGHRGETSRKAYEIRADDYRRASALQKLEAVQAALEKAEGKSTSH